MDGPDAPSHDLAWYQSRWKRLMDTLSVSEPEAVVGAVDRLQARVERLQTQHEALAELDVSDPERALQMIENMADQLGELYAEREAEARDSASES
jgi:alkyl sulfatase BDS1-like metallo-beta-lactamase superfamily hydrolase